MSAQSLGKRKHGITKACWPKQMKDKCPFCHMNLPKHAKAREAHANICEEDQTSSSSVTGEACADSFLEYESDLVFVDDDIRVPEHEQMEQLEDIDAWIEALAERGTLSTEHMLKFMNWGPMPLTEQETKIAEFMSTVTSGVGMSEAKIKKLLKLWNKHHAHSCLPETEESCWNILEEAHARMTSSFQPRSVTVAIPPKVQMLLYEPLPSITWTFWNPIEVLVRLLTMGPLAAIPSAFALSPVESEYLDDFCHGEKMKRIYNAVPRNTCVLSSILFFDEINRDQKGYATGEGAIVVGAFFNKEARNSTYAKASLGTFPKLPIPKVCSISLCVHLCQLMLHVCLTTL